MIKSSTRARLWIFVFLALLAFAALVIGTGTRHMRPDEHIAYDGTQGDLISTIEFQARDVHAPLYFALFYLWQQVAGDAEFTGRVFSILPSMLTLALVFYLGRRWFKTTWAAAGGMLALGLSSYFYIYALEIRPYALVMLVAATSMLFFARWLERRVWRSALAYGLTVAVMLYLHYFGLFLILLQGVYFAVRMWGRWSLWRQAAGAWIGAFVLWLPWFPVFLNQVRHVGVMVEDTRVAVGSLGMAGTTMPTDWPTIQNFLALATNGLPLLFALILALGAIWLWRREMYWLAVAWGIGVPLVTFLVNIVMPVYEPRYVVHLVPGLALLIGVSLAALPGRWKWLAMPIFALVSLWTVGAAVPDRVPVRDYLRQLEAAYQPGDVVYLYGVPIDGLMYYHYRHYAPSVMGHLYVPAYSPNIENVAEVHEDDSQLPRRVWFVTRNWHDPEVQARFEAMSAERAQQEVLGDHEGQRYVFALLSAPPETEPRLFGDVLRFLGADVSHVQDDINLKLWWDVLATPDHDYSMGVYLLDEGGGLVIQSDGPIHNWGQEIRETSALQPDIYYIDHRALILPPDLPPGHYRLALAVYHPEDGRRLAVEAVPDGLVTIEVLEIE